MVSSWQETNSAGQREMAFQFDHISLQSWGLSNRTLNALLSYNFKMTIGDVIRAGKELSIIRGLGGAGIEELNTKLAELLAPPPTNTKLLSSVDQKIALLNSKISIESQPKLLPSSVQDLPLDYLHLDKKTQSALDKAGINTIGELYNTKASFVSSIVGFHTNSLGNINDSLVALMNCISYENSVDWFQFWKVRGIDILPSTYAAHTTEQIVGDFPKIIEEILRREANERSWIIIQRRFGLGKVEKLTLEDMGNAYGLTRERIRQIEEKALETLQGVLVEQRYASKSYHVHPMLHQITKAIQSYLETESSKLVLENKLLTSMQQRFNFDLEKNKTSLFLLTTLIGAQRLEIDYQNAVPIWGYPNPTLWRIVESSIKRLDDLLTLETVLPQTEFDILVRLNRGVKKPDKLTLTQLTWLIDLCASVERREDSLVWGKFDCLKGRGNQVERILFETGSPMRVVDIARQINHRLIFHKQGHITEKNLSNQIIEDDRFVAIGRSGKWGLKVWSHIDTKSILMLMEDYLISQNKPATVDEIFNYVSERRPVSRHSIIMYLNEKGLFVKASRTTWGLAKWSDLTDTDLWSKEKLADFVANFFKSNKTRELSYKMLKEALMKEANITARQAQGLLNSTPAIKTRSKEAWGERTAVFQPNYKTALSQDKWYILRQKVSLRKRIEENAHEILNASPNKELPLAELIRQLHNRLECSASTAYSCLQTIESIERVEIADSTKKICRMKETIDGNSTTKGTLRKKISERVRSILETSPSKQIPLADLLIRLRKEYNCPKTTLYQYIAQLDYIERVNIPNSTAKLCRLKEIQGPQLFQQTQDIANITLKENVRGALLDLNEETVDIGLFRLGREFETTLKNYLMTAYAKGELKNTPGNKSPDQLKLVEMISCLKSNGIVTDDAALSYLRQQRNDRAHGGTPTLAERRVLMNNVQHLASLYIDYIKLLDDLFHSL